MPKTQPAAQTASRYLLLTALLACVLLAGCAKTPYTGRTQFMLVSEGEESVLGSQAWREMLSKEETETDTPRSERVEQVGRRIAAVAERPNFEWRFHTIPKDVLNAFCLPGGKVFVYTGILDLTQGNDDELAAVMGHEIAHAVARHGAERMSQSQLAGLGQLVTQMAVTVATGSQALGDVSGSGLNILTQLGFLLPYSRTHETEADKIGIILAAKAGYDPRAAISFWKKMAAANTGREPAAILSTHPLNEQRIADLEKDMPEALTYYRKE